MLVHSIPQDPPGFRGQAGGINGNVMEIIIPTSFRFAISLGMWYCFWFAVMAGVGKDSSEASTWLRGLLGLGSSYRARRKRSCRGGYWGESVLSFMDLLQRKHYSFFGQCKSIPSDRGGKVYTTRVEMLLPLGMGRLMPLGGGKTSSIGRKKMIRN